MRKFIVCLFALFVAGTAIAETMCVKLDASKGCTFEKPGEYVSDWTTTCDGVAISGVSYCSNQSANLAGKSESVTISGTPAENVNCWCKMTGPVVSSWVFSYAIGSAATCAQHCAIDCANRVANFSTFRERMFSDLH